MNGQGGFVASPQGGANWYPPAGGYTPVRGSLGVNGMGPASMFPDMSDRFGPMGNMMMQSMGYMAAKGLGMDPMTMMHRNMSPIESMYGRQYQAGFGAAVGGGTGKLINQMLTSYYTAQGVTMSDKMRASIDAKSKELAGTGLSAVRLASQLGINMGPLLSELPGVSLYQGINEMRGGTLMPGSMSNRIQQNLMGAPGGKRTYFGGEGGGSLSAGERGTLFGALGNRGLLPVSPAALAGDANSPKTQSAMKKLEGTMRQWEDVAGQLKGIFGSGRGIDKLLEDMDRALGGGMASMGPRKLSRIATGIQATMLANHVSGAYVTETMAQGALAAQSMGLVGAVGAAAGMSGINIGEGMVTARGGQSTFGQRSPEDISGIMSRRLLAGRASILARVGGGTLDLMRSAAVTRGVYREGMTNEQLARAVGASGELTTMVGNLASGNNAAGTLAYFKESNSMSIAKALQQSGITGTIGESLNQFATLTRGSQEMGLTRIKDKTILQAQETESFKRVISVGLRRPLREMGIDGKLAGVKIDAIARLFTTGAGMDVNNQQATLQAISKAAGVSVTTAQSLFNTIRTSAESDPTLRSMGGLEEMLGRRRSEAGTSRRLGMATSLAKAGNLVRKHMGKDSFIARIMDDLTSAPDQKGRKALVQKLLGDASGGTLGGALLDFGNKSEQLEAAIMTGASSKVVSRLKAEQMEAGKTLGRLTRDDKALGTKEEEYTRQKEYEKRAVDKALDIDKADITVTHGNIKDSQSDVGSASATVTRQEEHIEDKNMGSTTGTVVSVDRRRDNTGRLYGAKF